MLNKTLSPKKDFWLWAILAMAFFAIVALAPQIDLWTSRGFDWNGVYAINEFDEFAYASYVQSIMEDKPRRNSPFSGREDNIETPQRESLFSIQFLSTYPIAILAKNLNLSISATMILLSILVGILSAFSVYWLLYLFFEEASLSFVGTLIVLFSGALVAGQGSIISFISPESVHYHFFMMFLRRTNPATSFFALFLFFISVWRFFTLERGLKKFGFGIFSLVCFWITVYTYFYHWTTALAWFFGLIILWAFFKFNDFKRDFVFIFSLGVGFVLILIPWFILLSNRAESMDSAQLLTFTHQPDLWRTPEIISYLTIVILFVSNRKGWISIKESKFILIFSLALVSPIVFNQQVLTGHSLQPFHYQYFCANYISSLALTTITLSLLNQKVDKIIFHKILVLIGFSAIFIGYLDILSSIYLFREQNIWRDKLFPAAEKIKKMSISKKPFDNSPPVMLSFDFSFGKYMNSEEFPTLSSQPVMWAQHLPMFPDVDWVENTDRFSKFLYYQNINSKRLKSELENKNGWMIFGFFGPGRAYSLLTNEYSPITKEEIDKVVDDYEKFYNSFDFQDAERPPISVVIVHNDYPKDFSNLDLWYQRDEGEIIGDYTLFRVKLRQIEN